MRPDSVNAGSRRSKGAANRTAIPAITGDIALDTRIASILVPWEVSAHYIPPLVSLIRGESRACE